MKFWTQAWPDGGTIPPLYAAGCRKDGEVAFSTNLSPDLAWSELPEGAKSLALVVHDPVVPSRPDDVNQPDREVPADLPRVSFYHWVLADLPIHLNSVEKGAFSQSFVPRGKPGPGSLWGSRAGVNDYNLWFASNPEMSGDYYGYDGPFPPFNDSLVHRYVFTLYALGVERAPVEGRFTGPELLAALEGLVLDQASFSGTYTLNSRLAT